MCFQCSCDLTKIYRLWFHRHWRYKLAVSIIFKSHAHSFKRFSCIINVIYRLHWLILFIVGWNNLVGGQFGHFASSQDTINQLSLMIIGNFDVNISNLNNRTTFVLLELEEYIFLVIIISQVIYYTMTIPLVLITKTLDVGNRGILKAWSTI